MPNLGASFEQQQKKKKNPRDDRCRNLERKLNWSYKNESSAGGRE